MENLTPPALGWRRGAGGLAAGVVGRSGMGAGSRAAAGSGWKEQAGQVIGRAVRCSSGRPIPPRPGRSGRSSPWAARSFPVLIGAAAVLIGAGSGQKKSQGGRRGPFTLAFFVSAADRGGSFPVLIGAGAILPFAGGVRFFT